MTRRFLAWEGCVNVRDLGGLPLQDGGVTRSGAVVRSDNVRHLTRAGWEGLARYGVRTLVDLRFDRERDEPDPPFAVEVAAVSLFGEYDPDEEARIDDLIRAEADAARALTMLYVGTLARHGERVAAAVEAVAAAPAGGVVVHCFVGKDRTGIVSALLLELAGAEHHAIVADYALTEGRVASLVETWIGEAGTDDERAFRARLSAAPAEAMDATLTELRAGWGGARAYLRTAGLDDATISLAAARLR